MLNLKVPAHEAFDEKTNIISETPECVLTLEHSLVSISKWEAKWHKPFLDNDKNAPKKTSEEIVDYIKCMTITQNVNPNVYAYIAKDKTIVNQINDYISNPMTATTFTSNRSPQVKGRSNQKMTSELIYYWMVNFNIPFDCQKWHINRLLTLIRICNIYGDSGKKMSKREILSQNRSLNALRKSRIGTHG